jgi:hypothetical protein
VRGWKRRDNPKKKQVPFGDDEIGDGAMEADVGQWGFIQTRTLEKRKGAAPKIRRARLNGDIREFCSGSFVQGEQIT